MTTSAAVAQDRQSDDCPSIKFVCFDLASLKDPSNDACDSRGETPLPISAMHDK
jgi:hypothetical protein